MKVFLGVDVFRKFMKKDGGIHMFIWEKHSQLESWKKYVQLYTLESFKKPETLCILWVIFAPLTTSIKIFPEF